MELRKRLNSKKKGKQLSFTVECTGFLFQVLSNKCSTVLSKPLVIAKMDSSQQTALTSLIIFSYQTAVNIYKKTYKLKC